MRTPAALPRLSVPKKIACAVISAALLGSLSRSPVWAQSGPPVDLAQLLDRAGRSDSEAQNSLGNAYSSGTGVKQDYAVALTWYRRAAAQGFAPAEFNLGVAYEQGHGAPADDRQAYKYYLMAAEQGFGPAQFNVGNMYSVGRGIGQDLFEAALWYKLAAEKGITGAQFNLGLAYETGRGVKKDEVEAARWYQQAADRGFSRAQSNLGAMLEEGRGIAKNEPAAAALYRAASEQGFASAQNNYGLMIADGRGGLTKDPVQALSWLNLAVRNGANPAARDFMVKGLTPDQVMEAARLADERGKAGAAIAAPVAAAPAEILPGAVVEASKEPEKIAAPLNGSQTVTPSIAALPSSQLQVQVDLLLREKAALEKRNHAQEKMLYEKNAAVLAAEVAASSGRQKASRMQQQLDEATQALEKSGTSVAELTAENDRLEKELSGAKKSPASAGVGRDDVAKSRPDATDLAALREERVSLREENSRLRQAGADVAALRLKNEQLNHESEQLTAFMNSNRRDLDLAQVKVAELQKQLDAAKTSPAPSAGDTAKAPVNLIETNAVIEKLTASVAELTATNDTLEKDLANARKSTDAALASQSQAVSAAQPEAYKMEINTLQAHVKELEGQGEEERNRTAKEIASMAAQLQRTRETNRSLTDANHALLAGKENDTAAASEEGEQLRGKIRELTAAGEESRRQGQRLTGDLQKIVVERDTMKAELDDARKILTALPALTQEKVTLDEKLSAVGAQLIEAQRELELARTNAGESSAQLTESRLAAEKARADLAVLQAHALEAEKGVETQNVSVAELTQANANLDQDKADLRRLVESSRAEIARLTQSVRASEQERVESERSTQKNLDAVTAQFLQARREAESSRVAQARLVEAASAQDRERAGLIAQLRQENSALLARLTQAQKTLDQIAATARLGTPAAAIASGSPVPVRSPVTSGSSESNVRYHTVAEGDSLSRISMQYYGTPNRWQDVFQANREVLQGSNALRVGMQLRIP